MLILLHLITSFRVMNPHHICLQAEVKNWNEPKPVKSKNQDFGWSIEIKVIYTLDSGFPTIVGQTCACIIFKISIKHGQLSYGYHWGKLSTEQMRPLSMNI